MTPIADGYLYVPHDADGATAGAAPGETLRLPGRGPPWIVVSHAIDAVSVSRWPGRLFHASVIDVEGIEQPAALAHYTRAAAVRVGDEVPAWRLFGPQGRSVVAVISAASRLTVDNVETLAASRDPDASAAYARAWQRWLTSIGVPNAESVGDDLDGTLAIPVAGRQSPINHGFSVLSSAFERRAEELVGDAAFVHYNDGERGLRPTWSAAACALLEAAMSFGSPASARDDAPTLSAAWQAVVESAT